MKYSRKWSNFGSSFFSLHFMAKWYNVQQKCLKKLIGSCLLRNVFSLDLNVASELFSVTVLGREFQVAGAEQRNARLANGNAWQCKRLKGRTFICRRLQGNPYSSGFQREEAYWPALAVGDAAQLWLLCHINQLSIKPGLMPWFCTVESTMIHKVIQRHKQRRFCINIHVVTRLRCGSCYIHWMQTSQMPCYQPKDTYHLHIMEQ